MTYERIHSNRRRVSLSSIILFAIVLLIATTAFPADDVNSTVLIGNSRIDVTIDGDSLRTPKDDVIKWVQWSAEAVAGYYGRFPVPHTSLRIVPTDGAGVTGGRTWGDRGSHIAIHVGRDTTWSNLADDWTLTHEMVHLSFPSVAEDHHWIEEGIAVYVEPFARARVHHLDVNRMWFEVVRDMPKGLPQPGDLGLDRTHTWGRTYWGGAMFCLLADIQIHEQTQNRKGLQDALRGILDAGGDIRQDWDLKQALSVGDKATGVSVLMPLYEKMKDQPYDPDLASIWAQLGIERDGDTVKFIDSAPLAQTRQAITWGAASPEQKTSASLDNLSIFAGRAPTPRNR
jgi:hypothetical protein